MAKTPGGRAATSVDAAAGPRTGGAFTIVGIGASAGGLEAFTRLLEALPGDTGMAFVFVQHLAPTHASALAEILSRATPLPVMEVRDEQAVEPNHVYVIPPGQIMGIAQGRLQLRPRESHGVPRPIDQFLRALAEEQGHQAIGVILSGTGTDGTIGLDALKAGGGITFAQDASAQHDGMPHSAVAAGCVDFVLAPDAIAREIARIGQHPHAAPSPDAQPQPDRHSLDPVLQALHSATGVDFGDYKFNTLYRRITRRMVLQKVQDLRDYVRVLHQSPAEVDALYHDILIGVTSFFRDPQAFDVLKTNVFPRLLEGRSRRDPVRIWSLGCSTGQEAYSLAMAFAEAVGSDTVPLQVFATDLVERGVTTARAGVYAKDIAQDVSPERLRRFFVEVDAGYQVSKAIRDVCIFSRHNVLADPPFSRIDLISCRNLLIYLEPVLQQQVMPILHYAMKPTGFLWLGGAETIGSYRTLFEAADVQHKIYTKKAGPHGALFRLQHGGTPRSATASIETRAGGATTDLHREADRLLLSRFAPPSVLVNLDLEILQYRGDTSPYLAPAPGKASLNLLKMLREGVLVGVRAAILRAGREHAPVREEGLRVRSADGDRDVAVEVVPLRAGGTATGGGYLLLFDETAAADRAGTAGLVHAARWQESPDDEREGARLAQELSATRDYLQAVIEQQEAANEELQSANEEVQSANEELQSINEELETSKEEIQSSNEELATVNDELNNRNLEMNRLNNDLVNLIGSVQMAIVIVGPDLRIRRFTPAAEKLLELRATDVGRRLAEITLPLDGLADLEPLLTEVIDTVTIKEHDVRDAQGHWYSLRLRPYRTLDHKIDGVVAMLVDVDAMKRAQEASARLAAIVTTSEDAIISTDLAGLITSWNTGAGQVFGYSSEEVIGRPATILMPPSRADEEPQILERVRRGEAIEHDDTVRLRKDGSLVDVSLTVSPLEDGAGRVIGASQIARDITERRRAQAALLEHQQRLEFTLESAQAGDWELDLVTGKATCSFRHDRCFGATEPIPDWSYDAFLARVHPDDRGDEDRKFRAALASGQNWSIDCRVIWPDGSLHWIESSGRSDRFVDGTPTRMLGLVRDTTERKRVAEALREGDLRVRALVSASSDVVYSMNADWTEMRELHGRDFIADTATPNGTWLETYIPPEDHAKVMAAIGHAVRTKDVFQLEHRVRRVDGTVGWTSSRAVPLVNAAGEVIEWVGMASDVTQRHAAEEVLRQSEDRYRTLVEQVRDYAIFRADVQGRPTTWNEGVQRIFGFDEAEFIGQDVVARMFTPEDVARDVAAQELATVAAQGSVTSDRWMQRRNGERFFATGVTTALTDGHGAVHGFTKVLRDVTERVRVEGDLRDSEARFRTLADNISQLAWMADAQGLIYWYNQRWYDYTGTTLEEMRGWGWKAVHHPDHVDRVVARIQRSWDTGELWEDTFPLRATDGTFRWFLSRAVPVRSEDGSVLRWFGTNTDITEQRQMADELRQYAAELSDSDRRKDEFLAMLAHELRGPLAPIRNAMHLLRHTTVGDGLGGQAVVIRSATDMMDRQTTQLVRLVDDLLDVSRVSLGKIELRHAPLDLALLMRNAVEASQSLLDGAGVGANVTVPPDPVQVNGDAARLAQVIGNLLSNAAKFTPRGGSVWITIERDHGQAVMRVRDNGVGLSSEHLAHVFDLFMQVDTSLERTRSGLGLGLTLSRTLVELHDGTITAHSRGLGHGTEFVVRLPLFSDRRAVAPAPSLAEPAASRRRVLVVDDNVDSAESLAMLLEFSGHEVRKAYDGLEAVEVATTFVPDVILLDIGLPKLNGFEAAQRIRALPTGGHMLMVALTGWGQDSDLSRSADAGFDLHLVKPVDPDALAKLIATLPPPLPPTPFTSS